MKQLSTIILIILATSAVQQTRAMNLNPFGPEDPDETPLWVQQLSASDFNILMAEQMCSATDDHEEQQTDNEEQRVNCQDQRQTNVSLKERLIILRLKMQGFTYKEIAQLLNSWAERPRIFTIKKITNIVFTTAEQVKNYYQAELDTALVSEGVALETITKGAMPAPKCPHKKQGFSNQRYNEADLLLIFLLKKQRLSYKEIVARLAMRPGETRRFTEKIVTELVFKAPQELKTLSGAELRARYITSLISRV